MEGDSAGSAPALPEGPRAHACGGAGVVRGAGPVRAGGSCGRRRVGVHGCMLPCTRVYWRAHVCCHVQVCSTMHTCVLPCTRFRAFPCTQVRAPVHMCVFSCTHVFSHARVYSHALVYSHAHVCTPKHTLPCIHMHTDAFLCVHACSRAHRYVLPCTHVYSHAYMCTPTHTRVLPCARVYSHAHRRIPMCTQVCAPVHTHVLPRTRVCSHAHARCFHSRPTAPGQPVGLPMGPGRAVGAPGGTAVAAGAGAGGAGGGGTPGQGGPGAGTVPKSPATAAGPAVLDACLLHPPVGPRGAPWWDPGVSDPGVPPPKDPVSPYRRDPGVSCPWRSLGCPGDPRVPHPTSPGVPHPRVPDPRDHGVPHPGVPGVSDPGAPHPKDPHPGVPDPRDPQVPYPGLTGVPDTDSRGAAWHQGGATRGTRGVPSSAPRGSCRGAGAERVPCAGHGFWGPLGGGGCLFFRGSLEPPRPRLPGEAAGRGAGAWGTPVTVTVPWGRRLHRGLNGFIIRRSLGPERDFCLPPLHPPPRAAVGIFNGKMGFPGRNRRGKRSRGPAPQPRGQQRTCVSHTRVVVVYVCVCPPPAPAVACPGRYPLAA